MTTASDTKHDDDVIELAKAYVRAHNDWRKAFREHGFGVKEERYAWETLTRIENRFQRQRQADRERDNKQRRKTQVRKTRPVQMP